MANYFNLVAGFITFLGATALCFVFWSPIMLFLDYFSAESMSLYVMSTAFWVAFNFVTIVILPYILIVKDDVSMA